MDEQQCVLQRDDIEKPYIGLKAVGMMYNYKKSRGELYPVSVSSSLKKGLCCHGFWCRIDCSICKESMEIPVKENVLDNIIAKEINKIHDHTSILQKLVIVRSNNNAYPEFTINNRGYCSMQDNADMRMRSDLIDDKKDILCGLCEKPINCYLGGAVRKPDISRNIFDRNVYEIADHYHEHIEKGEYHGKYVKPSMNLEDAVKKAFENYKAMEKTNSDIIKENAKYFNLNPITKPMFDAIIKSKGDCSCGSKTIFECKLCGKNWKGDDKESKDYYKHCIDIHIRTYGRRQGTHRDFIIETTGNARCIICGVSYDSPEVLQDTVLSHLNKCLEKNGDAVKRKMESCRK